MISLKGFYRAGIDIFGIFSIYGAMMLSIISAIYFLSSLSLLRHGINPISTAGVIGIIYLVVNLPNYSKLLREEYNPSDKEKGIAIILTAIYLVLLLYSIIPYL